MHIRPVEPGRGFLYIVPSGSNKVDGEANSGHYGNEECHPQTSPERLIEFAASESSDVRHGVALNPRTPESVLRMLAVDLDPYVALDVTSNPSCPADLLLARMWATPDDPEDDEDPLVYWAGAAEHFALPAAGMEEFLRHEVDDDFEEDDSQDDDGVDDSLGYEFWVLGALASNLGAPTSILSELSRHWSADVRKGVASNPVTPDEILTTLATDDDSGVAEAAQLTITRLG